jgi:hypothetical protein
MSLELAPEIENAVIERAAREGTTASELIARLLRSDASAHPGLQRTAANDPVLALLQARLDIAQAATPEEAAAAEAEWKRFTESMNESRRANGEAPLYPERQTS